MGDPSEHRLPRTRLGNYEIVRKLARGGMAELFLACDVDEDDKVVVLKQILPRYAANQRYVQLFLDEAKLAASLHHPNIAEANDLGEDNGNYFFTMEYVHGQDVRSILRRTERTKRKVPIDLVLQIARATASALHYAHERRQVDGSLLGVVHRDVSPSNILVGYDGAIKLADFGVAKASSSSVRTRTGTLKGKVGYMSPEQARGAPIDRRSDIFSLGVVLWELLSLRRLFKSDNDLATIQSIINGAPPELDAYRDDCPPAVEAIIRRALEKDPATRFQTAEELATAIETYARSHERDLTPASARHYLAEVFAPEIAAWRLSGTVTNFVLANEPTMQLPPHELIEDASFSDSEDDSEPDDEDDHDELDDDDLDEISGSGPVEDEPALAPRAGSITVDAELEKTDFSAPPIMLALEQTVRADEAFEAPTSVNAFHHDGPTVQASPFAFDNATATEIATLPRGFVDMPSVVVSRHTPPGGMALQRMAPPAPPPMAYPSAVFPQQPEDWKAIDLTPKNQWLVIGGIAFGVALLMLIAALASC
ncbi:MAG: serine/threonine-protein kinase [Kofleriaceae bacterium]